MIRDDELSRLIKYAQGMGIKVSFKPYLRGQQDRAQWTIDGTEITIFLTTRTPKIDKVLTLIHEIAHGKVFAKDGRKIHPELEEALNNEENKKKARKMIFEDEVDATKYWEEIYRDTNCKFDINKLYSQREFDIWSYEVYYETNEFPNTKMIRTKLKQLNQKYGKK
jgi:hypothetical protein